MAFEIDHVGAVVLVAMISSSEWQAEATLFAVSTDDRRLLMTRATMSAGGQRRGIGAIWRRHSGPPLPTDCDERQRVLDTYRVQRRDVEDAVNQLLGRDPEMHRPPRLSWDPLIELLGDNGTVVTEDELIAMPFVFEFSAQSLSALDAA